MKIRFRVLIPRYNARWRECNIKKLDIGIWKIFRAKIKIFYNNSISVWNCIDLNYFWNLSKFTRTFILFIKHSLSTFGKNVVYYQEKIYIQSQNLIRPSHPAVATLEVSWGCQIAAMHALSWAFHFANIFVVFQSQMQHFPSPSPLTI